MLLETYIWATSKSVPAARKAGLVSEVASISGRYGRHKDAWTNHIEKTCAAIEKHIPHIDPKKNNISFRRWPLSRYSSCYP